MINLKGLSDEALFSFFRELGLPSFRSKQLFHWIYDKYASTIDEITEFSAGLREELSKKAYIENLKLASSEVSSDGTKRFLFTLEDGEAIESVLIPDGERLTLCVSSQAGCGMGCKFCVTGTIGLKRNLTPSEIVDQAISVNRSISPARITNIVFMGMGEPLLNLEALSTALQLITKHIKISRRRVTVSTCGIVPGIIELGLIDPPVNLAVSLNAPDDKTRSLIMPVNRKYPV
ncbi:MAG: 23S rRNA (adenine(2503)-C(2))-methyltransferase RlmN, partial [bacterium]